MKSKRIVLLAFLLMLYIVPLIFAPSSYHTAIPAEQNTSKDFSPSEKEFEIYLATDGEGTPTPTGDYTDTQIKDESSMFNVDASGPYDCEIILDFALPEEDFHTIYLNFYGYTTSDGSATTKELTVWNGGFWIDFGDIAEDAFGWTNITLNSSYIQTFNTVYMKAHAADDSVTTLLIDYAEVVLCNFSYDESEAWYDKDWGFRKMISIEGASGAGTNYQVQADVTFISGMQADFDDVLYTDNDGETLLDFWRESYTASTIASFWVEVADNLDTDQMIYMYWGNDAVSTTSDGEATFLLFDDFEDNNLDNWADTTNMEIKTDRKRGSYSASWTSSASNGLLQDDTYNGLSGIRVSLWQNTEDSLRGSFLYVYSEADYSESVATVRGTYETDTSPIYYRDTGVYVAYPDSADDLNDDEWDRIEFAVDFNADTMQTWQNGVANGVLAIVEDDGTPLETEEIDGMGLLMQSSNQVWFDDVIVRKWVDVEPIVTIFGDIETAPPIMWNLSGNATLLFAVALDTAGLDMLLIFLGLILIPVSTLYLVKGGRSDMSTDKLFFVLILFFVGWGLFLGGILG